MAPLRPQRRPPAARVREAVAEAQRRGWAQVAEELERKSVPRETVGDFIRRVSPGLEDPVHLTPITDILEGALTEPFEAVTATPPRHAKTTTILHDCVLLLERDPTFKIAYVTYATELAETKSLDARRLAEASVAAWENLGYEPPMRLDPMRQNLREWRTTKGGMFVATGIGGGLTGMGFNLVIVDDPFKGRVEAESPLIRQRTSDWFDSVAYTRREPKGTSFLINATRWHRDDLSGRMIARGWRSVNLKAIDDARGPLWPKMFGLEQLLKIKGNNEYEFAALYQGEPVAREAVVFRDPFYYDAFPEGPYQYAVGVDFAYTAGKYSDFSVAVLLRICPKRDGGAQAFVVDVLRQRGDAPSFKRALRSFLMRYSSVSSGGYNLPPCRAYIAGIETGIVDFMSRPDEDGPGVFIEAMPARGDKFARAQDVAAAWNRGDVPIPREGRWLQDFKDEVTLFTGVKDPHDDQVDALAAAYVAAVGLDTTPFDALGGTAGDGFRWDGDDRGFG